MSYQDTLHSKAVFGGADVKAYVMARVAGFIVASRKPYEAARVTVIDPWEA